MKLGQNFVKYFVRFLGNGVSRKNAFEIYWPLKDPQPDVILKPTSFRFMQSARNVSSKGVEWEWLTNNRIVVHTRVIGYMYIHNSRHVLKYVSITMYGLKSFLQEHPHILNQNCVFTKVCISSIFEQSTIS